MIEKGLRKFKKETGVDFIRLMIDKDYRLNVYKEEVLKPDTDEDELELIKIFSKIKEI